MPNHETPNRIAGKRRAEKALAKLDDAAPRGRLTGWLGGCPQRTTIAVVYATGMTCGVTTELVLTKSHGTHRRLGASSPAIAHRVRQVGEPLAIVAIS